MAYDGLKTFSLPLEEYTENRGTLRTDIIPSAAMAKGTDFSVDFKIVYEVRGKFDQKDVDNASLFVIRVIPRPNDFKQQFLWFRVKLSVEAVSYNNDDDDDDDDENIPQLKSFEPASQGSQFVDVYTTNESRERLAEINAAVPIGQGATLGGKLSANKKSDFTRTHLLQVTSGEGRTNLSLPSTVCNYASWTVVAANENQGIGDSFTVVLLIKRRQGAQFKLAAEVDGNVGTWSTAIKGFVRSALRRKKPRTFLNATFPSEHTTNAPPGVSVEELHRASTDNVMRVIPEVGLHLPEHLKPTKFDSSSLEFDAIGTRTTKQTGLPSTGFANADSQEAAESLHAASIAQSKPASGNIGFPMSDNQTTTAAPGHAPAAFSADAAVADLLAAITQRLRMPHTKTQLPQSRNNSSARLKRHREIASLYERLAELHREEAKESEETAFAAGFMD